MRIVDYVQGDRTTTILNYDTPIFVSQAYGIDIKKDFQPICGLCSVRLFRSFQTHLFLQVANVIECRVYRTLGYLHHFPVVSLLKNTILHIEQLWLPFIEWYSLITGNISSLLFILSIFTGTRLYLKRVVKTCQKKVENDCLAIIFATINMLYYRHD